MANWVELSCAELFWVQLSRVEFNWVQLSQFFGLNVLNIDKFSHFLPHCVKKSTMCCQDKEEIIDWWKILDPIAINYTVVGYLQNRTRTRPAAPHSSMTFFVIKGGIKTDDDTHASRQRAVATHSSFSSFFHSGRFG